VSRTVATSTAVSPRAVSTKVAATSAALGGRPPHREEDPLTAHLDRARGHGRGARAQRVRHLAGREPQRAQPRRVEQHLDLARHRAERGDRGDAGGRLQPPLDPVAGDPLDLEQVDARGDERQVEDRLVVGVELLDGGGAGVIRQRGRDRVGRLFDVDRRLVDRGAERELDDDEREPLAAEGADVGHPCQARDGVLDGFGELLGGLGGPAPG
jgi:hypothetical protein